MRTAGKILVLTLLCVAGTTACERPEPRATERVADQKAVDKTVAVLKEADSEESKPAEMGQDEFARIGAANAEIAATGDSEISGIVRFTPDEGESRMRVDVLIEGLNPGMHGFHIHSEPDCGNEGKSAGGHFNPYEVAHGSPNSERQHVGDLGNITADQDGKVETTITTEQLAFTGSNNILHRAVVVHADKDDLRTQPSGDSGARVACGVVLPAMDVIAEQR